MIWYRIDNRLVHGQIIETWLPHTKAGTLVIANDALADDNLRQQIMLMAVPQRVRAEFVRVDELPAFIQRVNALKNNTLVLFENCEDVRTAFEFGVPINICNVGNLHYAEGKRHVCPHVALSADDESCLRYFEKQGVELDFRCVPADNPELNDW